MLRSKLFWAAPIAIAAALVAPHALAQSATQDVGGNGVSNPSGATDAVASSSFDRGSNVSVMQRSRILYQPLGIHLGGFMVDPTLDVGGGYDDNILGATTNAVGDGLFILAPGVNFTSQWSRNSISGFLKAQQEFFATRGSEDQTSYSGGLNGSFQAGDGTLTAGGGSGQYVLPRTAANNPGQSVHPISYDLTTAYGQFAQEFTRVRLTGRVDFQDYIYQNGETALGAQVFQKFQDHNTLTYMGKAEFALTPDTAIFVTASGNNDRYDLNPPTVAYTRNSDGFIVAVGANFDITHLIRGEAQIGYLSQTYVSPLFKPISGLSAKGSIEWFPTQLTTVTLAGGRSVQDAGLVGSAGYLDSNGSLTVDHELLRNLILSAFGRIEYDNYGGIDRNDDLDSAGVSADYFLTRRLSLGLTYTYLALHSHGADFGPSYDDNRIVLTAHLKY